MPDHVRKQIRDHVANKLAVVAGKTWNNVYESRVKNIPESQLPVLLVYTKGEVAELITLTPPRTSYRMLSLTIEIYVKANADYDDTIDECCKQIEESLSDDFQLDNLAKDIHLDGVDIDFNQDGDKPAATCEMNWTVEYAVLENAPDVAV